MKTCTKCGEAKPLEAFHKDKRKSDGRVPQCKACRRQYSAANANAIKEQQQDYRLRNADKIRDKNQRYYAANRDRHNAWNRSYYVANRIRIQQRHREWAAANPDSRRDSATKRRARKANVPHEQYSRIEIFAAYGHACAYCGAPAEHLDHVVPISKGGPDAAHNLLPACAPCNLGKSDKSLAEWALSWLVTDSLTPR